MKAEVGRVEPLRVRYPSSWVLSPPPSRSSAGLCIRYVSTLLSIHGLRGSRPCDEKTMQRLNIAASKHSYS